MSYRCKQCRNRLVQKADDGVHVRSQGALVFTDDGRCLAKCFFCKTSIELPLALSKAEPDATFTIPVAAGHTKGRS